MRPLSIMVDIDGVCADTLPVMLEVLNKTFNKNYTPEMCIDYDLTKLYGPDATKALDIIFAPIAILAEPLEGASEVLREFYDNNIPIFYVTSRSKSCQEVTIFWLWENNFPPGSLHFVSSKTDFLVSSRIDIVVEDNPKEALDIARYKPVLLYDQPYNRSSIQHPNITRVKTWWEIREYIIQFSRGRGEKQIV